LLASAGKAVPLGKQAPAAGKRLGGEDLSAIFGLDMAQSASLERGQPGANRLTNGSQGWSDRERRYVP
jgi:hypothetical protein